MAGRLADKVALISGGARGMGASHAEAMIAEGAQVVIADLLDDEGAATAERLGDAARYVHLDVTSPEDWAAAVAATVDTFGKLNVLVNNAGIINVGTVEDYDLNDWHRIIDINLTGVFLGMRASVKALREAGGGSIVNISSIEGLGGTAMTHGYTAAKFGVRGITKSAAWELGQWGYGSTPCIPG